MAGQDTWELVAFVRRVAALIQSADAIGWLRAGLAVALIEAGRYDFHDLIVSLVLFRFAAERAGIASQPYFDEAIAIASPEVQSLLRNAREHSERDARITVMEFGPEDWAWERGT